MRVAVLIGHGPNWKPGHAVYDQGPSIQGHLESMRRLFDAGTLLIGGPFDRGAGLALFEVPDEATAIELMADDPGVRAGVFSYETHPLTAYFDAFAGVRTADSVAELGAARRGTATDEAGSTDDE